MTSKGHRTNRLAVILGLVGIIIGSTVGAQGIEVGGEFLVGVSNTDNVFLLSDSEQVDETVYQIRPSLEFDYNSERIIFNGRYQFDYYKYSELDSENRFHQYDVLMSNELLEDAFYFDLGGSRTQSIVDPDGIIPPGNLPISNNLVDRKDYYLNPRFERTFGNEFSMLAEYRYQDVNYDNTETDAVLDSENEDARFELDNYENEEGLTVALNYEWEESTYDDDLILPWEYQMATAELGIWAGRSFRIFGSGGLESAWDDPIDRSLQDKLWEAGFAYEGSERLRAEFAAGERSFGDSWRGDLEVRFRRGELSLRYDQTPTTIGRNQFSAGLLDPDDPSDLLTRPNSAERFISKRGELMLALEFRTLSVDLTIFDEERIGRMLADGTPLPDEAQDGAILSLALQIGNRTELVGEAGLYNRNTTTSGDVRYVDGNVALNYIIGTRWRLSAQYDYAEQAPETLGATIDYTANTVSLFLSFLIGR